MTAANLAVIFGPNLLQKERGGDVSPQVMGIEDSTAIISVTLMLIQNHRRLFTVLETHSALSVICVICGSDSEIFYYVTLISNLGCLFLDSTRAALQSSQ